MSANASNSCLSGSHGTEFTAADSEALGGIARRARSIAGHRSRIAAIWAADDAQGDVAVGQVPRGQAEGAITAGRDQQVGPHVQRVGKAGLQVGRPGTSRAG
jgi:hypothetical protein